MSNKSKKNIEYTVTPEEKTKANTLSDSMKDYYDLDFSKILELWKSKINNSFINFHSQFFINFLPGKIKYYLKSKELNLIWETLNESLRFCREYIDLWILKMKNVEKDEIYNNSIFQKNEIFNFLNICYFFWEIMREIKKITSKIYDTKELQGNIAFDVEVLEQIRVLRKFYTHPFNIEISKSDIDFISRPTSLIKISADSKNIISMEEEDFCFPSLKGKKSLYIIDNYSKMTKPQGFETFIGTYLTGYFLDNDNKKKNFYLHTSFFRTISNFLNSINNVFIEYVKFCKNKPILLNSVKKEIVKGKRIEKEKQKMVLNFSDYQDTRTTEVCEIRIYQKITGVKALKKRWNIEVYENGKIHKTHRNFTYVRNGIEGGKILNDNLGHDKIWIIKNVKMTEHFGYTIYENFTSFLVQMLFYKDLFELGKNNLVNIIEKYTNENFGQRTGLPRPIEYIFGFCDVFNIDNKILKEKLR